VTAILELEEIIFAFKHRVVGVNTGKWNYMHSIVKRFKNMPSCFLPFRDKVLLDEAFTVNFNKYVVHIAHKRGIHVIGGASNFVPRIHYPKATL